MLDLLPERRWLALYCTDFVALATEAYRAASLVSKDETAGEDVAADATATPPPPAVLLLPDSIMRAIFRKLDAESLSACAQVCGAWRAYAYEPVLWRALAHRVWQAEAPAATERLLWFGRPPAPYGTWRSLLIRRPKMRASGVYVKRHHYAKSRNAAVNIDGSAAPVVSLVTYWRLLRFYNDGTVISLITPERPDRAVRRLRLNWEPLPHEVYKAHPSVGSFTLSEEAKTVELTLPVVNKAFPNAMDGTHHMSMSLAGTHASAFNRLYLRSHFAIFEDGGLQEYSIGDFVDRPWHFVRLNGFSRRVYEHFPPESDLESGRLGDWAEDARKQGRDDIDVWML